MILNTFQDFDYNVVVIEIVIKGHKMGMSLDITFS